MKSQTETKISLEQVRHIADLAKISLTKKEEVKFQKQLGDIIEYFKQLNEVDTAGVEPTSQVTGLKNKMRADLPLKYLSQKAALSNAPDKHKSFFKILTPLSGK